MGKDTSFSSSVSKVLRLKIEDFDCPNNSFFSFFLLEHENTTINNNENQKHFKIFMS
jgi:predicted component of viral defense system (DUF524 family)